MLSSAPSSSTVRCRAPLTERGLDAGNRHRNIGSNRLPALCSRNAGSMVPVRSFLTRLPSLIRAQVRLPARGVCRHVAAHVHDHQAACAENDHCLGAQRGLWVRGWLARSAWTERGAGTRTGKRVCPDRGSNIGRLISLTEPNATEAAAMDTSGDGLVSELDDPFGPWCMPSLFDSPCLTS
jgi:hypothetical protein